MELALFLHNLEIFSMFQNYNLKHSCIIQIFASVIGTLLFSNRPNYNERNRSAFTPNVMCLPVDRYGGVPGFMKEEIVDNFLYLTDVQP